MILQERNMLGECIIQLLKDRTEFPVVQTHLQFANY